MNRATELSLAFMEDHSASAARTLDGVSSADAAALIDSAPEAVAASVVGLMQPARAAAVLERLDPGKAAALLSSTPAHVRSVLLRALREDSAAAMLGSVSRRQAAALRRYMAYDPATVGAWMDAPQAEFLPDTAVGDCLQAVRRLGKRLGSVLFVTDDQRRLLGTVGFDDLLSAEDGALVSDLMDRRVASLAPQASLHSIVSLTAWDRALALPVVDRSRRLIGVLHFDSLREGLVVDRSPAANLGANVVIVHLAQAFLVSAMGLLHAATSQPPPSRIVGEGEGTP